MSTISELANRTDHGHLVTTAPEPTNRKILRRSVLVVLAIVLGLAISMCHIGLAANGHVVASALTFAVVTAIVAAGFARLSPERHLVFGVALSVPALLFTIAYVLVASPGAPTVLWYAAPVVWLLTGSCGAVLGQHAATKVAASDVIPPLGS